MKYIKVTRLELQSPDGEIVGVANPKDLWWCEEGGLRGDAVNIEVTSGVDDATRLVFYNRKKWLITSGLHEFIYPKVFLTKGEVLRIEPSEKEKEDD